MSTRRTVGRTSAVLVLVLVAAGCASRSPEPTGSSSRPAAVPTATPFPTDSTTAGLRRAAKLEACPQTASPAPSAAAAGTRLPALTLPCLGAPGSVDLGGLRGTPMVVNIWASWCEPCYREMPTLQAAHVAAGSRVRFLGVDIANAPNEALKAVVDTGVRYPSVSDQHSVVPEHLGLAVQPVTLFVRSDGTVAHTTIGPVGSVSALRSAIRRYLGVQV